MKHGFAGAVIVSSIFGALVCSRVVALDTVTWGGGNGLWSDTKWVKNGIPNQSPASAMGDSTGGRGGSNISIGGGAVVTFDPNSGSTVLGDYNVSSVVDSGDYVLWKKGGPLPTINDPTPGVQPADYDYWRGRFGMAALGDFKPRMDVCGGVICAPGTNSGGSITIKEGAILTSDAHSDQDGRWARIALNMTLDGGTMRRTYSAPSLNAGRIMFGYHDELLANQRIEFNIINGGRLESQSKMVFGEPDYFIGQGGSNNGHNDGIEVAMTIDNGTIELTDSFRLDYPFGQLPADLLFIYDYNQAGYDDNGNPDPGDLGHPRNEKYSINFTGPGSITINPEDLDPFPDDEFHQWKGGINVIQFNADGSFTPLGGAPDQFTPIGFKDLWDLGILQANGQSGIQLGSAAFNTYFSTTGSQFDGPYTLTSLVPGSGSGLVGGAVPEPTSAILALMGLAVIGFGRRCRPTQTTDL